MKKVRDIFTCLLVCFFLCVSFCFAETITLKSGAQFEGDIVQQTKDYVKLDIRGITLTYYWDEVEKIGQRSVSEILAGLSGSPAVQKIKLQSQESLRKIEAPEPQKLSPGASEKLMPSSAQSKKGLVLKLIEVSGAKKNMQKTFGNLIANASLEEIERIRAVFNVDQIIEQLIPVYDKYFTKSELQSLIDFYSSPAGRKLLEVTPKITEESMRVTLEYFQKKVQSLQPK